MIQVAPGTKVHLALRPLSMRYGFDGLSAKVVEVLRGDPFSGHLFIFRSKRGGLATLCILWIRDRAVEACRCQAQQGL